MTGSGDHVRLETTLDAFERVLAKLERLDERVGDLRVDIVGLRNAIDNVRSLVDGVHARAAALEIDNAEMSKRLRALEDSAAEQRGAASRRTTTTVATAVGSGGLVAALAEAIRAFVGMP
jgi:chromosome segregation ATPase